MSSGGPRDPRWRARLDSWRRAGLERLTQDRFAALAARLAVPPPAPEPIAPETPMPAEPKTSALPKAAALALLAEEVAGCTQCAELCASRTQTVFSDGSFDAEICFVGEAPGADEDAQGVPFIGKAGQLLTKMIEACKLRRDEVYICNVLKCRPPGNRNPEWQEMLNCQPYLIRQLAAVRPKALVGLGRFASAFLLQTPPEKLAITKVRGTWHEYQGIPVMPTLHPAYLLRDPSKKKDAWADLQEVMRRLGRPVS
jgi:uracil-DNA glycosylase